MDAVDIYLFAVYDTGVNTRFELTDDGYYIPTSTDGKVTQTRFSDYTLNDGEIYSVDMTLPADWSTYTDDCGPVFSATAFDEKGTTFIGAPYVTMFISAPTKANGAIEFWGDVDTVSYTHLDVYKRQLHTYTIVDAINDKNVLPFRVDYIKTMEKEPDISDKEVWDIDRERAYLAPERIEKVVEYILDHFDQKTKRNERAYSFRQLVNVSEVIHAKNGSDVEEIRNKTHIKGFNSIFAVSSVEAAKLYYTEFRKQMAAHSEKAIRIATIYSFAPNESEADGLLGEEDSDSTSGLDTSSRDFLEGAIREYNEYFGTNYDTSAEKFPNYYKDVSLRMKNKDIDLLIVVNMFLTGFDATTLNTLWVDKNLKIHGLIQAYSRTNRIDVYKRQ